MVVWELACNIRKNFYSPKFFIPAGNIIQTVAFIRENKGFNLPEHTGNFTRYSRSIIVIPAGKTIFVRKLIFIKMYSCRYQFFYICT